MKWLIACIVVLGLSACGTTKVDFEKQALIQVQPGDIIWTIDGQVVYSAFSQREQPVTPGRHVIVVTRFGDIRFDRGEYLVNVSAGLTYQIAKYSQATNLRQTAKVTNTTGTIVDELILSMKDRRTFLDRADAKLEFEAQQAIWQEQSKQQAALAEAERQRKLSNLPRIRKIGAQICQRGDVRGMKVVSVGYVEGITDEKVQIRISRAYFESSPSSGPGGFSPSIIWDYPTNWDLCE